MYEQKYSNDCQTFMSTFPSSVVEFLKSGLCKRPCTHEPGQFLEPHIFYPDSCGLGLERLWRAVSKQWARF